MSRARLDWILFGLLACIWGSSYLFFKIAGDSVPPFTVVATRLFFGTVVLTGVAVATRARPPRDPRTYAKLLVLAVVNVAIPMFLISWGEHYIDSSLAGILQATTPLFTIVLGAVVLSDEAATIGRIAGLGVGFIGAIVLVGRAASGQAGNDELLGELAVTLSSLAYAAGSVYARHQLHDVEPKLRALFQIGFAFAISVVVALALEQPLRLPARPEAIFAVAWMGTMASAIGYLIFFRLLDTWGPTRASLVTYLQPLVAISLGMAVRGEQLEVRVAIGTALVFSGVWLVNSRYGRRRLSLPITRSGGRSGPRAVTPAPAPAPEAVESETDTG